eukprot:2094446-Prorocentrum_lima.AAC.1
MTSSPWASEALQKQCPHNHHHWPIEGSISWQGSRINLSSYAGGCTEKVAAAVVQAFADELVAKRRRLLHQTAFLADDLVSDRRRLLLDD